MDAFAHLLQGFGTAFAWTNLASCFAGVLIGTLVGVLPGIGPVATMAILLPFTFTMGPAAAIIMLCGIYYGSQYGGSTTSILVNIPGEVGSVVTCLDGYKMARNGRAGAALGISAIGSFIGGTLGIVGLMFLVPLLSQFAAGFGPPELFALVLFGLLMVSSLGSGSLLKAIIMAVFGIFVSLIGQESMSGFARFTFGSYTLTDGVGLAPAVMGMFGIAEVLTNIEANERREAVKTDLKSLLPTWTDWIACRWAMLRGTLIGFFLGILPGAGTVMTSFFAYWLEKKLSKHPEKFGTGVIEGVAAPETANNAATSGGMIPLIALGVPASPTMAILLGALVIQGIQPGPFFIAQHGDLFWGLIASMYVGNIMLLVLNLPLIGMWVKILSVPYRLLFPLIILLCIVGVYSLNSDVWEVAIMIAFGVIGYVLKKMHYPLAPFLLALVLGNMMETSFRQSMAISGGELSIFFERPFSAVLMTLFFITLIVSWYLSTKKRSALFEQVAAEAED